MNDLSMTLGGFLIGMLLTTGMAIYFRDQGRDECESKLPRTEKCVQQWVPAPHKGGA